MGDFGVGGRLCGGLCGTSAAFGHCAVGIGTCRFLGSSRVFV